jgi:ribosomal protein L37E
MSADVRDTPEPEHAFAPYREPIMKHGVCKRCGKRKTLWLPAQYCARCVRWMSENVIQRSYSHDALDALEAEWAAEEPDELP